MAHEIRTGAPSAPFTVTRPRALGFTAPSVRSVLRVAGKVLAGIGVVVLGLAAGIFALLAQPYWPMYVGLIVLVGALALGVWLHKWFGTALSVLAVSVIALMTASQLSASTPPITDSSRKVVPGSIAEMRTVKLGGVDQWVMIRGRSTSNPILLYLSGGPGGTQYALNREYNSELENDFVVVNWEQRGTGKSAGALFADWQHSTPQQYTADGLQLTAYLRQRFHQDRIYLWGQSWGTMLGVWMVQQRPEWFAAWIGVGQMTSPVQDDRLIYNDVLQQARQSGDTSLVQKLAAVGPPPYHGILGALNYTTIFGPNDDRMRDMARASGPPARKAEVGMMDAPEYGLANQLGGYVGLALTFPVVYDQLDRVDLTTQAANLGIPVYFVEGRYDLNARTELTQGYYDALQAPAKKIVWFEPSGHNPAHEEPAAFNDFMVNTVLAETR